MSSPRDLSTSTALLADVLNGSTELRSLMLEVLSGYETMISATVLSHAKRVMTLTPEALLKSVAAGVGQLALIETFRQAVLRPTSKVAPSTDTGKSNFI